MVINVAAAWTAWGDRLSGSGSAGPAPELVEGTDAGGAVAVSVDADCRVRGLRLGAPWRRAQPSLGEAVIEAGAAAVGERLAPEVEVLADVSELPGRDVWSLIARGAGEGAAAEADPMSGITGIAGALGSTPESWFDDRDRQLAEVEARVRGLDLVEVERRCLGRSRRGEVEVELDVTGLPIRVTCRPDWLATAVAERVRTAIVEAFDAAYGTLDAGRARPDDGCAAHGPRP